MKLQLARYQSDDWLMDMKKGAIYKIYVRESSIGEKLLNKWSMVVHVYEDGKFLHEMRAMPYDTWRKFQESWHFVR